MAFVGIAEPDVTLTDFGLALECALFAVLLHRSREDAGSVRAWFVAFFAALAAAALLGGVVHGFLYQQGTFAHSLVWNMVLIAIGIAALSAWMIGSRFAVARQIDRLVRGLAIALFAAYCIIVLFVRNTFAVAVIHYLPAVFFLFFAFAHAFFRSGRPHLFAALIGLSMTLVAAGVQQMGIAVHPVYFDHNALYHAIQAVAVLVLFLAARGMGRYGV